MTFWFYKYGFPGRTGASIFPEEFHSCPSEKAMEFPSYEAKVPEIFILDN
jgi:hypothetical protein